MNASASVQANLLDFKRSGQSVRIVLDNCAIRAQPEP